MMLLIIGCITFEEMLLVIIVYGNSLFLFLQISLGREKDLLFYGIQVVFISLSFFYLHIYLVCVVLVLLYTTNSSTQIIEDADW